MTSLRIIFAGTPSFAAQHLEALLNSKHQVIAVLSQEDKVVGRGNKIVFSPVKELALKNNIEVFQFKSLKNNPEVIQLIADLKPDLMVVVAYGMLIPESILNLPKYGCINVHASLLPKWRGAAPIQRSIEAGDPETGICIMKMEKGLDTGDVYKIAKIAITDQDTSQSLFDKLSVLGQTNLIEVIDNIETSKLTSQVELTSLYGWQLSYAHKITKEESMLDFNQSAPSVLSKIRAFDPWPGCYFFINQTIKAKIIDAELFTTSVTSYQIGQLHLLNKQHLIIPCGNNQSIKINSLQLPNKKPITANDFINGYQELLILKYE